MIGLGLVDDPSTMSKEFCGPINTSWYFQYRCKDPILPPIVTQIYSRKKTKKKKKECKKTR